MLKFIYLFDCTKLGETVLSNPAIRASIVSFESVSFHDGELNVHISSQILERKEEAQEFSCLSTDGGRIHYHYHMQKWAKLFKTLACIDQQYNDKLNLHVNTHQKNIISSFYPFQVTRHIHKYGRKDIW